MEQQTLSITEVARELRVSPATVARWIESGELRAERNPFVRSRRYRVTRADLDALKRAKLEAIAS